MKNAIKNILIREMERVIAMLKEDRCEMTDAEAMNMVSALCHEAMSKEQVLVYLSWSRSKFDNYVSLGMMPKGKPRSGFKELVWYRDEINDALIAIKNQKYKV